MKQLIGVAVVLIALFLSNNVFVQDSLRASTSSGLSGLKHDEAASNYGVASKDEIKKKEESPFFTWDEAVEACESSTVDGKTDWKLPEKEVLDVMYEQLYKQNRGGFANDFYWSSSEFGKYFAWDQNFTDGHPYHIIKGLTLRVRCVRAL
jgi:Protein of unknown function (DUF1566)